MTEFIDLGKYCQLKHCNRQDYLPFECKYCGLWFCKEHWEVDVHQCKKYTMPNVITKDIVSNGKKIYSNTCDFPKCKIREIVPLRCKECGKNHCFKHRQPFVHKCSGSKE